MAGPGLSDLKQVGTSGSSENPRGSYHNPAQRVGGDHGRPGTHAQQRAATLPGCPGAVSVPLLKKQGFPHLLLQKNYSRDKVPIRSVQLAEPGSVPALLGWEEQILALVVTFPDGRWALLPLAWKPCTGPERRG